MTATATGTATGRGSIRALWVGLASTSVSGRPLAITRILYAAAALVLLRVSWRRLWPGFDPHRFHIAWPVVGDRLVGLPPVWPALAWGAGALVLASGFLARPAAAALVVGMVAFFAADQQHYANGGYFIVLVGVLLVLTDSGASLTPWGPDRRRASWWTAFLLASQMSIVYGYAAVMKLRPESLAGHTLDWQLHGPLAGRIGWSVLPVALNLVGFAAEAFCAVGLWFASTRRFAVAVGIGLHLGILVFVRDSWDMLAFGLASVALYPAFSVAAPPLAVAIRSRRGAVDAGSARPVADGRP